MHVYHLWLIKCIRPLLRDRSWECPEHDIARPIPLPDFEADHRPVSAKHHVQNLSLKIEQGHGYSSESTSFESANEDTSHSEHSAEAPGFETYATEAKICKIRRGSFSTGLGLAYQEGSDNGAESSDDLVDRHYDDPVHAMPKMIDQEENDVGLSRGITFTEACGSMVVSDEHGSSKDHGRKDTDPTRVPNGIAVTEEAVDLGAPDIIMQV